MKSRAFWSRVNCHSLCICRTPGNCSCSSLSPGVHFLWAPQLLSSLSLSMQRWTVISIMRGKRTQNSSYGWFMSSLKRILILQLLRSKKLILFPCKSFSLRLAISLKSSHTVVSSPSTLSTPLKKTLRLWHQVCLEFIHPQHLRVVSKVLMASAVLQEIKNSFWLAMVVQTLDCRPQT